MSLSRRLTAAAVALLASLALPALFQAAPGAASPAPRVSVISDSILTAVTWSNAPAQAALSDGLDLQIDAGVCRRLNGQSCEFNGSYVPTTLSVINTWITQLGSIVVIVDGYNDLPDHFAGDVELTLNTLRDHGVQHVLWVNLHNVQPEYAAKNAVLAAAAQHHPELRVLDWNSYAAPHPEWFQTDFIHLRPEGGIAIASWIHQAIADTLAPPPAPPAPASQPALVVPTQAMVARVGVRFARHLRAGGGTGPLRWRPTGLSLRRAKLHLLAGGELTGRPTHARTFTLPLEVTDAHGSTVKVTVRLTVKARAHAHRASHPAA
jgi:hypothetical protein